MNYFAKKRRDFLSFTAVLDNKGRVVIPSYIRKKLQINFDSEVFVSVSKSNKSKRGENNEK